MKTINRKIPIIAIIMGIVFFTCFVFPTYSDNLRAPFSFRKDNEVKASGRFRQLYSPGPQTKGIRSNSASKSIAERIAALIDIFTFVSDGDILDIINRYGDVHKSIKGYIGVFFHQGLLYVFMNPMPNIGYSINPSSREIKAVYPSELSIVNNNALNLIEYKNILKLYQLLYILHDKASAYNGISINEAASKDMGNFSDWSKLLNDADVLFRNSPVIRELINAATVLDNRIGKIRNDKDKERNFSEFKIELSAYADKIEGLLIIYKDSFDFVAGHFIATPTQKYSNIRRLIRVLSESL